VSEPHLQQPRKMYRLLFPAPRPVIQSPSSSVSPSVDLHTSAESPNGSDLSSLGCRPLPLSPAMSRTPSVGQQPSQPGVKPAILPPAQRGVKPASLRLVLPTTGSAGLPQLQQQQSAAAFDNRQERWECCTSHFLKIYLLILGGGGGWQTIY
jgi:hypothetical protein